MERTGILTVISGFSGAGKGTIMKELVHKYPYFLSISATTRKPREGEVDGREYFFHTREEFEQMIAGRELIEWAEYVGNYYGTPKVSFICTIWVRRRTISSSTQILSANTTSSDARIPSSICVPPRSSDTLSWIRWLYS